MSELIFHRCRIQSREVDGLRTTLRSVVARSGEPAVIEMFRQAVREEHQRRVAEANRRVRQPPAPRDIFSQATLQYYPEQCLAFFDAVRAWRFVFDSSEPAADQLLSVQVGEQF